MMANMLSWIRARAPGVEKDIDGELRVEHADRSVSSLWYRDRLQPVPEALQRLGSIYDLFDGADLFSSTFKIASAVIPRVRGGVAIVPTLDSLSVMAHAEGVAFPSAYTVFMYQAGIGFYAVSQHGGVYEWDTETGEISGQYDNVLEVFDEWFNATNDGTRGR
jgi:hypothetical protein